MVTQGETAAISFLLNPVLDRSTMMALWFIMMEYTAVH